MCIYKCRIDENEINTVVAKCMSVWRLWVRVPSKDPVVYLNKKLYLCCLVLVGSRNGFERDFTIELK